MRLNFRLGFDSAPGEIGLILRPYHGGSTDWVIAPADAVPVEPDADLFDAATVTLDPPPVDGEYELWLVRIRPIAAGEKLRVEYGPELLVIHQGKAVASVPSDSLEGYEVTSTFQQTTA